MLAVALFGACSSGSDNLVTVTQTVGATGGTVSAPAGSAIAGASLMIPAGALAADATVTIKSGPSGNAVVSGFDLVGPVIEIAVRQGTTDVTLSAPATLSVPYNTAQAGTGTVILYKKSGLADPVVVSGATATGGTVTSSVDSFSLFWAMVAAQNPPTGITVTGVNPNTGDMAGGTAVTISGTNFSSAGTTTVSFGGVAATNVAVASATQITCTTPAAAAAGVVALAVTNNGNNATLASAFTYTGGGGGMSLAFISPTSGPLAGGTSVQVFGSDFPTTGLFVVTFGGVPATNVIVSSTSDLTCTTPAGAAAGAVDVVLTVGAETASLASAFTYNPAPSTFGTWSAQSTTDAPSARFGHGMVAAGGKVYVFGGRSFASTPQAKADGFVYDATANTWTALPSTGAPSERYWHQMIALGTKVYVFGGSRDQNPGMAPDSAVYDSVAGTWAAMSMTSAPTEIDSAVGDFTGNRIFVFGRISNVSNLYIYDAGTDTWTAGATGHGLANTTSVDQFRMAWTGSLVIAFDSTTGEGARYDPVAGTWSAMSMTGAPTGRNLPATGFYDGYFVVYGGDHNTEVGGAMYQVSTDTWTATSTVNEPGKRSEAHTVPTGNGLFLFGGSTGSTSGILRLSDGYWFIPSTNTWEKATVDFTNQPTARSEARVAYVGTIIVFGGVGQTSQALSTGANLSR